jgi:uncharacterized protein
MYRPRIAEQTLKEYLNTFKAVAIIGPKFCGKTTLSERFADSSIFLTTLNNQDYKTMLQLNPDEFFSKPYPKLIDEWQLIPEVWDAIRHKVDHMEGRGHFILTGSSVANLDDTAHSGAGRIGRLILRPMSLYELGVSSGKVRLRDLFDRLPIEYQKSAVTVKDYATWIIKGGWPDGIEDTEQQSALRMKSYIDALIKEDINKISDKKYNETRTSKILESLARFTGSESSNQKIISDLRSIDASTSEVTLLDYLDALRKLYVIEDLKSWSPNLRSKTVVRATAARFFVDPSFGASVLGITSPMLLKDFSTFGLFFEALAVRDLRVYAEVLGGKVLRYKDSSGLEIDLIVQLASGQWCAMEVKMGSHLFDDAASKLITFAKKIDTTRMEPPQFLAILTATEYAYQREDGIYVIPLGMLRD